MRKLLFIITAIAFFSCNDNNKNNQQDSAGKMDTDSITADTLAPGNIQEERDALQTSDNESEQREVEPVASNFGKYRKIADDQTATDCNSIEISYDRPTEWCIDKDKMYINARCQKTGANTADVYFVSASREHFPDKELPWEEFDTDTPVATLTFQPDGSAELDWLGFAKNGELVTEYALYGKKTLEGTYNKE